MSVDIPHSCRLIIAVVSKVVFGEISVCFYPPIINRSKLGNPLYSKP